MVTQNRIIEVEYRPLEKTEPCLTNEEKQEICCGITENDEPIECCEVVSIWHGYTEDEFRSAKEIPDEYEVRPLARQYPCGEQSKKPDIYQRACCDGVSEMEWDDVESAEWVSPNSSAVVYVNNGKAPYTWTVRGEYFYANSTKTQREITTTTSYMTVYTGTYACGVCDIIVVDSCGTEVTGMLKSTLGSWDSIPLSECPLRDETAQYIESASLSTNPNDYSNVAVEAIIGEYKIQQTFATSYGDCVVAGVNPCSIPNFEQTCLDAIDVKVEWYSYRPLINLISPEATLSAGVVSPTSTNPSVADQTLTDKPWQSPGHGFVRTDKWQQGSSCHITDYIYGNRETNVPEPLAWKWVC